MVDCHGRHSLGNAIEFCRVLAPYRPYLSRSPCRRRMSTSWRRCAKRALFRSPPASGCVTRYEFRELIREAGLPRHPARPLPLRRLGKRRKIAAMAETYTMGVAPHNPLGPVANAAALHFALSTPELPDPGRYADRRALAMGGGAAFSPSEAATGCRMPRASASK